MFFLWEQSMVRETEGISQRSALLVGAPVIVYMNYVTKSVARTVPGM